MRCTGWVFAVSVAVLVGGCTTADDLFGNPADGFPEDTVDIANSADWDDVEAVVVDLSEFRFSPKNLRFDKGRPYALTLTNSGSVAHRFRAAGFFRAIAARSVIYSDGEGGYPVFEAIGLGPQESKTINFVPVVSGDYAVSCDEPLHAVLGMEGRVVIE